MITPIVAELAELLTSQLLRPDVLGDAQRKNAASLVMSGIDYIFRLSDSNLKSALDAFDAAVAKDPRGSYFAWQAFLTAFLSENRREGGADDIKERARLYAARALEADRHNPLVMSLLAHVYAFVLRDFDRAFAVIDPLRGRNPDCIMFYDNLAMLHFYTGDLDRARDRARQAVDLGRANPYRYSFETSLLMIESVAGNIPEAIAHGRRSLAMQPQDGEIFGPTLRYLSAAYGWQGDDENAARCMRLLERQGTVFSIKALAEAEYPVPSEASREFLIEGLRRTK